MICCGYIYAPFILSFQIWEITLIAFLFDVLSTQEIKIDLKIYCITFNIYKK